MNVKIEICKTQNNVKEFCYQLSKDNYLKIISINPITRGEYINRYEVWYITEEN